MGIQYLQDHGQPAILITNTQIPDCMQLLTQLTCIRPPIDESPDIVYLFICTRFKTWGIMENEVASRVCDLVFNIMYTSLQSCCRSIELSC